MKHFRFPFPQLAVCILAWELSGTPAHAQWSTNPIVNNAICTVYLDQEYPAIVSDGAGGAIIAWQDSRGSSGTGIYAQRIDASGVVRWTADGAAISTAEDNQSSPTITSDSIGGAIITWQDWRSGGNNADIYAQRINASGAVQWTANGVPVCTAAQAQAFPTITSDGAGGAIITWHDFRAGTYWDIYAQRINASGAVQWTANGVAISAAVNDQYYPAIVSDGVGGAIITWEDWRSGNADIYAQRINALGAVQWTANGVAVSTASNRQGHTTIVSDGAGGAIITWEDYRAGDYVRDIYAQRINASGTVQWITNGVAICTAAYEQLNPTITSDGAAGAIITWSDKRCGNTSACTDIYAQRINALGAVQWTANGVAVSTSANILGSPTITSDGVGGAIITWDDFRSGDNFDIYARRINASGAVQWTANGVAISTPARDQVTPTIVSGGGGSAIITWKDSRNSSNGSDIYAQQVRANGQLGVGTEVQNDGAALPETFRLEQNYPNPFNPTTVVRFEIPAVRGQGSGISDVKLGVYDLLGREVAVLVNEVKQPGTYVVQFDGSNLASGVYFYRIQARDFVATKRLLLLK